MIEMSDEYNYPGTLTFIAKLKSTLHMVRLDFITTDFRGKVILDGTQWLLI